MSLNKKAQEYLDKCRVIGVTEVKEGIVVSSNPSADFEVYRITVNGNDAYILYYDSEKNGTIMFGNSVYTVLVSGVIEKNELIKIAESIK